MRFRVDGEIIGQGSPYYRVIGSKLCFKEDCEKCELFGRGYVEELTVEVDSFGNYLYHGEWSACEEIEDLDVDDMDYFRQKYEGWG